MSPAVLVDELVTSANVKGFAMNHPKRPTVYIFTSSIDLDVQYDTSETFAYSARAWVKNGGRFIGNIPDQKIISRPKRIPDLFVVGGIHFGSPAACEVIRSTSDVQFVDVNVFNADGVNESYKAIFPLAVYDVIDTGRSRFVQKGRGNTIIYTNIRKLRFTDSANSLAGVFVVKGLFGNFCAGATMVDIWKKANLYGARWDGAIDYYNGILDVQGIAHDNSD